MPRRYSYLTRKEEKKNIRKAYFYIGLSVFGMILMITFGIPILAKFAGFVGGLKKSGQTVENLDTTPPVTPKFFQLPDATNKQKLDVDGTAEPSSTVELNFNGDKIELVADNSGEFSTQVSLVSGDNTLSAVSIDSAGNKSSESDVQKINFDNNAPKLEITSPDDGTAYYGSKQRQVTITGSTEVGAKLRINDRFVLVEDDGSFTFITTLTDGENKFTITAVDDAGNDTQKPLTLNFTP